MTTFVVRETPKAALIKGRKKATQKRIKNRPDEPLSSHVKNNMVIGNARSRSASRSVFEYSFVWRDPLPAPDFTRSRQVPPRREPSAISTTPCS